MKQAYLILAHEQSKHLKELIDRLDTAFSNFYIHIDKKSKDVINSTEVKELQLYKNVIFTQSISINWGGFSLVKAELILLREAIKDKSNSRFHLISGVDYPLKSNEYIFDFFKGNKNDYILWDIKDSKNRYWIDCFYFYDWYYGKSTNHKFNYYFIKPILVLLQRLSRGLYQYFHISLRKEIPGTFYHSYGAQWFSITRNAVNYVLDYLDENQWYIKRFSHTAVSDETFFVMLIMNSERNTYAVNDNLRYFGNASKQIVVDEFDYDDICSSNAIFGRKFCSGISDYLMALIDNQIR